MNNRAFKASSGHYQQSLKRNITRFEDEMVSKTCVDKIKAMVVHRTKLELRRHEAFDLVAGFEIVFLIVCKGLIPFAIE